MSKLSITARLPPIYLYRVLLLGTNLSSPSDKKERIFPRNLKIARSIIPIMCTSCASICLIIICEYVQKRKE